MSGTVQFVWLLVSLCHLCLGLDTESILSNFSSSVAPLTSIGISTETNLNTEDRENYPNPRAEPLRCKRGNEPSWICDMDGVIDSETADKLNRLLESLYILEGGGNCLCTDTSCTYRGLPLVIIVMRQFPFYGIHESPIIEAKNWADYFLNNWKFDTCADGVVVIISAADNLVVTSVGQSAHRLVSDLCQSSVENVTLTLLHNGQVVEGVTEMVNQYRLVVDRNHACNSDHYIKTRVVIPVILIIVGIIIAVVIAIVLTIYRRRQSKDITVEAVEANVPLKDQSA